MFSDSLVSIENLIAGHADDVLIGNAAANRLAGRWGSDRLTGGAGADHFVFDTGIGKQQRDQITDFKPGNEVIELSVRVFTVYAKQIGARVMLDQHLSYQPETGELSYDSDGAGSSPATVVVVLGVDNHPAQLADDFLIIG